MKKGLSLVLAVAVVVSMLGTNTVMGMGNRFEVKAAEEAEEELIEDISSEKGSNEEETAGIVFPENDYTEQDDIASKQEDNREALSVEGETVPGDGAGADATDIGEDNVPETDSIGSDDAIVSEADSTSNDEVNASEAKEENTDLNSSDDSVSNTDKLQNNNISDSYDITADEESEIQSNLEIIDGGEPATLNANTSEWYKEYSYSSHGDYEFEDGYHLYISRYSGTNSDIYVPARTIIDGKEYVTYIESYAYSYNENITSVVFESGCKSDNLNDFFFNCKNLTSVAFNDFDASQATSMKNMFSSCSSLKNVSMEDMKTDSVTDLSDMFYCCSELESIVLPRFSSGNLNNLRDLFYNCAKLSKIDLNGMNTSNVTDMSGMFGGCDALVSFAFDDSFYTGNVTNMSAMFSSCDALESLDLSGFDTSKVTDMGSMFGGCGELKTLNISSFDTGNVTNMQRMFDCCSKLENIDVSGFNTSKVSDMSHMFYSCSAAQALNLSSFDTSNVTDMERMFEGCSGIKELDLSSFNTAKVINMDRMFAWCSQATSIDVSSFNTASVKQMKAMFEGCGVLSGLSLGGFNTRQVTDMSNLFAYCRCLEELDLGSFVTTNAKSMRNMFGECSSLVSLNLSGFSTPKLENMALMLEGCSSLESVDLSGFDTANVNYMEQLFWGCEKLQVIDISNFECNENYLYTSDMFCGTIPTEIMLPESWNVKTNVFSQMTNVTIYYPKTTKEWRAFGYNLHSSVIVICSDTNQEPEIGVDHSPKIQGFSAPSTKYKKTKESGMDTYTFMLEDLQVNSSIECTVSEGATWNLYSDEMCTDEYLIADHNLSLNTEMRNHYYYIKIQNEKYRVICKVNLKYDHLTSLNYMRDDPFTFKKWSLDKLIDSTDVPDQDLAQICLILSAKAEGADAKSALEHDFMELELYDPCDEVNKPVEHNAYQDSWVRGYAAHSFALTKYTKGNKTYNIITVVCRGTTDKGDFLVDAAYKGFLWSALYTYQNLKSFLYLNNVDIDNPNNRYLITGHSLGGAVANLLQYILLEKHCYSPDITCYTYASPYTVWAKDNAPRTYGFAINFVREEDIFPDTSNSYDDFWHNVFESIDVVKTLGDWLGVYKKEFLRCHRFGKDYNLGEIDNATRRHYRTLTRHDYDYHGNQNVLEAAFDAAVIRKHVCETYMACLLADIERGKFASNARAFASRRLSAVHCPVDVKVVDKTSGNVVAAIEDNKITVLEDENIQLLTIGDSKFVRVSGDGEYSLKLVGSDEGTMDCIFQETEYDEDGNVYAAPLIYDDVKLTKNKQFASDISAYMSNYQTELDVTDSEGNVISKVSEDGTETAVSPGNPGGDDNGGQGGTSESEDPGQTNPSDGEKQGESSQGSNEGAGGNNPSNNSESGSAGQQAQAGTNVTTPQTEEMASIQIKLEHSKLTLGKGGKFKLKANLAPDTSSEVVTWSSSNKKIATVSSSGEIKALKKGKCTITATCGSLSDSCTLTVQKDPIKIKKVSLNKKKLTLKKGESFEIVAVLKPFNATIKSISYKSDNKKTATVSKNGIVKAKRKGSCTITVTVKDKSGKTKTAKCTVNVK